MEAKAIQNTVKQRYKYKISYGKAWRAKQKALETRFESFFDSYDSVVRMLHTLQEGVGDPIWLILCKHVCGSHLLLVYDV
jgi:hypothetical protein